jgi:hypothetical protein
MVIICMQDFKRNTFLEADLQCSNRIQSMESKVRAACNRPDSKLDDVVRVRLLSFCLDAVMQLTGMVY